ncbi:hypothetical protein P9209_22315 [Prescottella defluvii]|nr:hypothetical protein P9209_22315 [Prescottella defluvii]
MAASLAAQVLAALVAGPVLVAGIYQIAVAASKFVGDWMISGWFGLLFLIVVAAAVAYSCTEGSRACACSPGRLSRGLGLPPVVHLRGDRGPARARLLAPSRAFTDNCGMSSLLVCNGYRRGGRGRRVGRPGQTRSSAPGSRLETQLHSR